MDKRPQGNCRHKLVSEQSKRWRQIEEAWRDLCPGVDSKAEEK